MHGQVSNISYISPTYLLNTPLKYPKQTNKRKKKARIQLKLLVTPEYVPRKPCLFVRDPPASTVPFCVLRTSVPSTGRANGASVRFPHTRQHLAQAARYSNPTRPISIGQGAAAEPKPRDLGLKPFRMPLQAPGRCWRQHVLPPSPPAQGPVPSPHPSGDSWC